MAQTESQWRAANGFSPTVVSKPATVSAPTSSPYRSSGNSPSVAQQLAANSALWWGEHQTQRANNLNYDQGNKSTWTAAQLQASARNDALGGVGSTLNYNTPTTQAAGGYVAPATTSPTVSVNPGSTSQTWEQKIADYATNKSAAAAEAVRAKQVYDTEKASYEAQMGAGTFGGSPRANEISHWADQVRSAGQLDSNLFGSGVSTNTAQNSLNFLYPTIARTPPYAISTGVEDVKIEERRKAQGLFDSLMGPVNVPQIEAFDINSFISQAIAAKQPAINNYATSERENYNNSVLPDIRAQEAAAGFLHSDTRFNRELSAQKVMENAIAKYTGEQQAGATDDAYKLANVAQQQQAQQLQSWQAQQNSRNSNLSLLAQLFGNIGGVQTLQGKDYDLKKQGLDIQGQGVNIQSRQLLIEQEKLKLEQALNTVKTVGFVPDENTARVLGVPVGTPSWEAVNAAENRATQLEVASISASSRGNGNSGGLTAAQNLNYMTGVQQALSSDLKTIIKSIDTKSPEGLYKTRDDALRNITMNEKAGAFMAYPAGYADRLKGAVSDVSNDAYNQMMTQPPAASRGADWNDLLTNPSSPFYQPAST